MHPALTGLIDRYQPQSSNDYQNAVREIVQEIALLGLWRTPFYDHAAFYGGSALRIFHGLQRFSEDLDFSLLRPKPDFSLKAYLGAVADELAAWGFEFRAEGIEKANPSTIESAFLKGSTVINLLQIGAPPEIASRLPKGQLIRIKLEIDTDPPPGATNEMLTRLVPTPHQVRVYDLPSLFAGKLHAVLCRNWKSRVKGRDFYDLVWYVGRRVPLNLAHLEARMRQSGDWLLETPLDAHSLRDRMEERFASIRFDQVKEDIAPFLKDPRELSLWSEGFFMDLIPMIQIHEK
ncbi:MAG: nucleotidyl transferase AbiEii/AbiGii toxin family protein [Gloeobacteraceae cyanobacterium ES-bin-144]|nr:nucleotidyl transferase AbiEii/AbiGii toxin family protein [Verrucomicrobiales bacterium]